MRKAGFLQKDAQYRSDGSQTSNAYFFLYHASLAPAMPVIRQARGSTQRRETCSAKAGGDKNVTPDKNVIPWVTSAPSHEDIQSNSTFVKASSSSIESRARIQPAAGPDPNRYPLSTARFRVFFPRITESVIVRILRAILAACPDCPDDDIAAAVYVQRDQHSPGLRVHTLPGSVEMVARRRTPIPVQVPKCQLCGDSGVVWYAPAKAAWCPAVCEATELQRHLDPDFVDEWNAHGAEKLATRGACEPPRTADPSHPWEVT
jgi:hypothetical protein